MQMKEFNKTTATVIAGAIVAIAAALFPMDDQMQVAVQTVLTALMVYFIPNKPALPDITIPKR